MDRLAMLLGSATRANILRVLLGSETPLSAYRLARECNMNVARVYGESKRLAAAGVIDSTTSGKGTVYSLSDPDLRRLVARFSGRVVPYGEWSSSLEKAARFRAGMAVVPAFDVGEPAARGKPRLEGELANLAALGKRKFDSKYRKTGARSYARV